MTNRHAVTKAFESVLQELSAVDLLRTAILCLGIAVFLTLLVDTGGVFWTNLLFSGGIGFGIHLSFTAVRLTLGERLPRIAVAALAIVLGLTVGLMVSAAVITGEPLYFLRQGGDSLLIGIFFGILGTLIILSLEPVDRMRSELAEAELARMAHDKQIAETRLRLLQAQIEPHVLFNTLANVVGLIDSDPKSAQRMIEHLTTLLRASLRRARAEVTTLGDELSMVRAYLEIQPLRMGPRLAYAIECAPDLEAWRLPPMLLQPLVENAVRHGLESTEAGGRIDIISTMAGDRLTVRIADDGAGLDEGGNGSGIGSGTGLVNVRERLQAFYGGDASLTLADNNGRGFVATVQLPGTR